VVGSALGAALGPELGPTDGPVDGGVDADAPADVDVAGWYVKVGAVGLLAQALRITAVRPRRITRDGRGRSSLTSLA
jgi:hypothetical protein